MSNQHGIYPLTPDKIATIRRLAREGRTVREVALMVGVGKSTVSRYTKDMMRTYEFVCAWCGESVVEDVMPDGKRRRYCSQEHAKKSYHAQWTAKRRERRGAA